jgi:hypothetical protein
MNKERQSKTTASSLQEAQEYSFKRMANSVKPVSRLPSPLTSDVFSPVVYKNLLKEFLSRGFEVRQVKDLACPGAFGKKRILILRHDVDLTPLIACEMAKMEAKLGIKATYYFLLSGGFYNILEPECRSAILEINKMGHEIGLHFDTSAYVDTDLKILADLVGAPIRSISQHNPTIEGLKRINKLGLVNAYDQGLIKKGGFAYISDSGMKWRTRTIFDVLHEKRVYFLAHPESWYSDGLDVIQVHRAIQTHEIRKIEAVYNKYVEGNIAYLKKRWLAEKR